jgi:hypothetical protein
VAWTEKPPASVTVNGKSIAFQHDPRDRPAFSRRAGWRQSHHVIALVKNESCKSCFKINKPELI